ncbi:uncharacterized protein BXZ73DRAFT_96679 [Epithele typhae]|uniref:uncharacterized protein n=1 Tax=Epithele typhae TaxID=378194 RepID=UPI002008BAAE|nr:uncharacterized protein BXZ73DRAFT_96679 [Epithele typhae]KAH9944186.1 hypothetical protein BXZ73DRAFT_96679 [Epithele typhae]
MRFTRQNHLAFAVLIGAAGAFYKPPAFDLDAYTPASALRQANDIDTSTSNTTVLPMDNNTASATGDGWEESLGARDVWTPAITTPDAATVWKAGDTVTVRWRTAHPPKHVTSYAGKLVLGHLEDGDDGNEHLDFVTTTREQVEAGMARITDPSETPIFICAYKGCCRLFPSKQRVIAHRKRDHDSEDLDAIITWNTLESA